MQKYVQERDISFSEGEYVVIEAKQNDNLTRIINFSFKNEMEKYVFPTDKSNFYILFCEEYSNGEVRIPTFVDTENLQDNVLRFVLKKDMLKVAGLAKCEFVFCESSEEPKITDSGLDVGSNVEILTTQCFNIQISPSHSLIDKLNPSDKSAISSLVEMFTQVKDVLKRVVNMEQSMIDSEEARSIKEEERLSQETARRESENIRVKSEQLRFANEAQRQDAESKRINAEKSREEAENARATEFITLSAETKTQADYAKDQGDRAKQIADGPIPLANNLLTTVEGKALDARQGKVLDEKITNVANDVAQKVPFQLYVKDGKYGYLNANNEFVSFKSQSDIDSAVADAKKGDATTADVLEGKTFTNKEGSALVGTMYDLTIGSHGDYAKDHQVVGHDGYEIINPIYLTEPQHVTQAYTPVNTQTPYSADLLILQSPRKGYIDENVFFGVEMDDIGQSKTVTASRSQQIVKPDSGKLLSQVTVNKYPDATGTFSTTTVGTAVDMGVSNNYRYVNTQNAYKKGLKASHGKAKSYEALEYICSSAGGGSQSCTYSNVPLDSIFIVVSTGTKGTISGNDSWIHDVQGMTSLSQQTNVGGDTDLCLTMHVYKVTSATNQIQITQNGKIARVFAVYLPSA